MAHHERTNHRSSGWPTSLSPTRVISSERFQTVTSLEEFHTRSIQHEGSHKTASQNKKLAGARTVHLYSALEISCQSFYPAQQTAGPWTTRSEDHSLRNTPEKNRKKIWQLITKDKIGCSCKLYTRVGTPQDGIHNKRRYKELYPQPSLK